MRAAVPERLGSRFRWLMSSVWVSNLGDGVVLAAGPLLVASQTADPFLVAAATMLQQLPWLLFGLVGGVTADRFDRRRLVVAANLGRAIVLAVLAATIVTDVVNVTVVLIAMFVLGTAETFSDTAGGTLLPMLVARDDLGAANAPLRFGQITLNRLAGPPLGAFLFAGAMAAPFAIDATLLALSAALVWRIGHTPPMPREEHSTARADIVAGLRFVWGHSAVRVLVITIFAFNITFGATYGIMVLYAAERLGLDEVGYGFLVTTSAVGAVVGTIVYGRLEAWLGRSGIMRVGLIIETGTHLVLALTTVPAVAFATMFVFGIHEASWGTTASTIRHRVVPTEFQGRVGAVYAVAVFGSLVVGSALGGVLAGVWGITAPFWFGFVGSTIILAAMWRSFGSLLDA